MPGEGSWSIVWSTGEVTGVGDTHDRNPSAKYVLSDATVTTFLRQYAMLWHSMSVGAAVDAQHRRVDFAAAAFDLAREMIERGASYDEVPKRASKCIVHDCENTREGRGEGAFVGDFCAPCHDLIVLGKQPGSAGHTKIWKALRKMETPPFFLMHGVQIAMRDEDSCGQSTRDSPFYYCSRLKDHDGGHIACTFHEERVGEPEDIVAVWS